MSTKGLILSGGSGTRLRPITFTGAKQLVPIANKPILFYGIESMVNAGIKDIGIVVGAQTASEVMEAVGDGSNFGASVTFIYQEQPLGLAHCVQIAESFIGDSDFVMYLGDNMLQKTIWEFCGNIYLYDSPVSAAIMVKEVDNPESFGVVELDSRNKPVRLVEKPKHPQSNLAMVGVYYFTSEIFEAVNSISPSARGELEITDAIQWLIDAGKNVECTLLDGWWIDTGKKDQLLECNRLVLDTIERQIQDNPLSSNFTADGRVQIGNAIIENSRIIGPASIADGAMIKDSYIGPYTSVGPMCVIENSEVQNSVLLEGGMVIDIPRLSDSLVGKNAIVRTSRSKPEATKLMISDSSIVEV